MHSLVARAFLSPGFDGILQVIKPRESGNNAIHACVRVNVYGSDMYRYVCSMPSFLWRSCSPSHHLPSLWSFSFSSSNIHEDLLSYFTPSHCQPTNIPSPSHIFTINPFSVFSLSNHPHPPLRTPSFSTPHPSALSYPIIPSPPHSLTFLFNLSLSQLHSTHWSQLTAICQCSYSDTTILKGVCVCGCGCVLPV